MPWRPDRASKRAKVTQGLCSFARRRRRQAGKELCSFARSRPGPRECVMLTTRATTWAAWIAAVLVLTASSMAAAATGLLSPNPCQGKITLDDGLHQGLASVSAETCRGCAESCTFDAAGLFVAPTTPAHRTFQPGPFAGESIPARSSAQAFTPAERAAIDRIGQTTGCHTCGTTNPGTRSGHFVPDYQPPSALNTNNAPQQLYPHCINCSREQGLAIARQRRGQ